MRFSVGWTDYFEVPNCLHITRSCVRYCEYKTPYMHSCKPHEGKIEFEDHHYFESLLLYQFRAMGRMPPARIPALSLADGRSHLAAPPSPLSKTSSSDLPLVWL